MHYDNQHTDKKLRELENQSLPDLSKMDEHWHQMNLLLPPVPSAIQPPKNVFRSKIVLVVLSAVIILVISFFFIRRNNHGEGFAESPHETTVEIRPAVHDTTIITDTSTDSLHTTLNVLPVTLEEPHKSKRAQLERFFEQIQKKPQAFVIDNRRDTMIYGKEGTMLSIPAYAFNSSREVTVLMTEFYSIDDMIAQKLTTTCDGQQLVTGGMIYLDARDKKDQLVDLRQGASLRLDMPKRGGQQRMELFYGYEFYRNEVTTVIDSINWTRTNQPFTTTSNNVPAMFRSWRKKIEGDGPDTVWITDKKVRNYFPGYYLTDTIPTDSITRKADSISIQRFGVNINRLGWLNCDRFNNDPRPRVDLVVDMGDNPDNYSTLLVFENMASIMRRSSTKGNTIRFANLPEGEPVRIVSFGIRNDKPATATKKLTISRTTVSGLEFEEINASAFRKKSPGNR